MADPASIDIDKFERETLDGLGHAERRLPMRHRTPHFGHVFSGEGYATAYYGYMWADVLDSQTQQKPSRRLQMDFMIRNWRIRLSSTYSLPEMLLSQQRHTDYLEVVTQKLMH